jgi:hypothetical protein
MRITTPEFRCGDHPNTPRSLWFAPRVRFGFVVEFLTRGSASTLSPEKLSIE